MKNNTQDRLFWGVGNLIIIVYAILPVLWILSLSLKPSGDLNDQRFFPKSVTLEHYQTVLLDPQFPAALVNSIGIGLIATFLAIIIGAMAAYAIVRLDFSGRRIILGAALATAMFPPVAIVGPLFNIWRSTGLFDTWAGLIIPYMTFTLPLAIWIIAAYFRGLPWELEKAARVDGASRIQTFIQIVLPMAAPGVFTAGILVFIFAWNDFLFAIALTSTNEARTVPAAIAFFTGSSRFDMPTGAIAAASVVVTIPVVLLVLIFQKRIVSGLTSGAVKG